MTSQRRAVIVTHTPPEDEALQPIRSVLVTWEYDITYVNIPVDTRIIYEKPHIVLIDLTLPSGRESMVSFAIRLQQQEALNVVLMPGLNIPIDRLIWFCRQLCQWEHHPPLVPKA